MRILVVEDETKVAHALKTGLEGEHYDVALAETGEAGFFLASTATFDIVVLDLQLPGRDGIQILSTYQLRTPLTAIRSVGEVALRERRDEMAYRETIGSMLEEVDRLPRLVEGLLTLSRADAGETRVSSELVNLESLTHDVVAHLNVLAEEKRQSIVVEATRPVSFTGDRVALRRALINLLDNAIKYSPMDATIRIRVEHDAQGVRIEVIDPGQSIPREHRDRIFDRFYRVDAARSRDGGGAGLGLSTARWAVEINGGHLEYEPAQPVGSVFRITLPADRRK